MSSIKCGIVGLPNVGKSTLFNALVSRVLSETSARPFTTIDPHEAVVNVEDRNLEDLSNLLKPEKTIFASITFIDIAGLVKDAHKGEGLGNQFLGKIREVDAIVHVVRAFKDDKVSHLNLNYEIGSYDQILDDIETVNLELELGEIKKPTIYVVNLSETDLKNINSLDELLRRKIKEPIIYVCAKLEEELIGFSKDEKIGYFKEIGVEKSGIEKLILESYKLLDLITFYTIKGGKEVHAWSLKKGQNVIDAARKVHTDFAERFITSEVIDVKSLLDLGSWKKAKEEGLLRQEGKDYIVLDLDVIEFKIGT